MARTNAVTGRLVNILAYSSSGTGSVSPDPYRVSNVFGRTFCDTRAFIATDLDVYSRRMTRSLSRHVLAAPNSDELG